MGAKYMSTSITDFVFDVTSNQNTYKARYKKRVREADINVQEFNESLNEFQKNIKKLRKYDSSVVSSERMKTQITDMVKSYNVLLTKYSNVDNDDISKNMEKLEQIFEDNSSILKKIGIKKDEKNWKFSESSFDSLETGVVKKYCTQLFIGRTSFINQISKTVNNISKCAQAAEYNIKLRKFCTNVKYSNEELVTAENLSAIKNNILNLCDYTKRIDQEALETDEEQLQSFITIYNDFINNSENLENEYLAAIKNYHKDNDIKTQFSKIGVVFDDSGNMMYDNTDDITKDVTYCNTFKTLFAEDSLYVKTMNSHCKNAINNLLKTEKYGIRFDEIV